MLSKNSKFHFHIIFCIRRYKTNNDIIEVSKWVVTEVNLPYDKFIEYLRIDPCTLYASGQLFRYFSILWVRIDGGTSELFLYNS
jgi:hypothetical protein